MFRCLCICSSDWQVVEGLSYFALNYFGSQLTLQKSKRKNTDILRTYVYLCILKRAWNNSEFKAMKIWRLTHGELKRQPKNGKLTVHSPERNSSISFSGFLNQYHVMTFWQHSAYMSTQEKNKTPLPQYIFFSLFLFTETLCLWQKWWQVTGATKINHLLPSTANKCEHLPSNIQTYRSVEASTRSIRFRLVHKWRIDSSSQVEVTADPVWRW